MEVIEWDPPTSFTLRASEAGTIYETHCRLSRTAGGTEVEMTFTVLPTNAFGKVVSRLMGRRLMASTGDAMAQILREIAASSSQGED